MFLDKKNCQLYKDMFIIITSTIVIVYLLIKLAWYFITKPWHHIPSPKGEIPFFGHILSIPGEGNDQFKYICKLHKEYNGLFVIWVFIKPVLHCSDVNMFEKLLMEQKYLTKSWFYSFLHDWLGAGLLTSSGSKWKQRRKLLTPCFHFDVLSDFATIFNRHSKKCITYLEENCKNNSFDAFCFTKVYALDVIVEAAMGVECHALDSVKYSKESDYMHCVEALMALIISRHTKPWFWISWIYKFSNEGRQYYNALNKIHSFVKDVVQERIKQRSASKCSDDRQKVFLDLLLDAYERNEINIEGILEEVNTFMFEGHDTVSSSLAWTLYLLGRNSTIQDKAYLEAQEVARLNISPYQLVSKLKFLDCIIKESLRLHPPVSFIGRQIEEEIVLNTIRIPKGTEVSLLFLELHRNEKIWNNALIFKPERFEELSFLERIPFSYVPFSGGPRNCIGQKFAMMEMKLVLYHILLKYKIHSLQEECDVLENVDIIHRCENGLMLKIFNR